MVFSAEGSFTAEIWEWQTITAACIRATRADAVSCGWGREERPRSRSCLSWNSLRGTRGLYLGMYQP